MIRHGKTHGNLLGRYIGTTDEPLLPKEEEDLKKYAFGPVDRVFVSPRKRLRPDGGDSVSGTGDGSGSGIRGM